MTPGPEVVCTAVEYETERSNPLFVPPCSCPRCAADPIEFYSRQRRWLRVSGRRQRFHVEELDLGPTGKASLG